MDRACSPVYNLWAPHWPSIAFLGLNLKSFLSTPNTNIHNFSCTLTTGSGLLCALIWLVSWGSCVHLASCSRGRGGCRCCDRNRLSGCSRASGNIGQEWGTSFIFGRRARCGGNKFILNDSIATEETCYFGSAVTFTCQTLSHVLSHAHVISTGTGVFSRALVYQWGRKAQELAASIHTVSLSAPVWTYNSYTSTVRIRNVV